MTIKTKHAARFLKLANELDLLIKEIHKYCPGANYYTTVGTLNLMKGETHSGPSQRAARENVAEAIAIESLGGGDW